MLRITMVSQTSEETVLKVEGWLSGEEVALLEQEGTGWLQKAKRLVLDLKGVKSIDEAGITLLQRWSGEALVLRGASSFVRALLRFHGLD